MWGPENLFSLNITNGHIYECFMKSLTKAEIMCITPLGKKVDYRLTVTRARL